MVILIPLLVALAGVLAYALANNPKVAEIGRIAWFAGLLVTLLALSGSSIKILPS